LLQSGCIVKDTNQPVIGGCNRCQRYASIAGISGRCGGVSSITQNLPERAITFLLQDSGWMNTTLAEVKIAVIYYCCWHGFRSFFAPRFFERYLWNKESMFLDDTSNREMIYLGKAPSGDASTSPVGQKAQVFECATEGLPEVVAVLRALVKDQPYAQPRFPRYCGADYKLLPNKFKSGKQVVTWAAGVNLQSGGINRTDIVRNDYDLIT
jgi:formylmethanofuran dehydrogenase subunit B